MLRSRKAKFNVLRRFSDWAKRNRVEQPEASEHLSQITSAIHQRQAAGISTTLRQLHKITKISQPAALSMVAELECLGLVTIDWHESDSFESTITLSEDAQSRLSEQAVEREPPQLRA